MPNITVSSNVDSILSAADYAAIKTLLDIGASHAASHTDGTDDIQSATNAQKGLATAAHISAIEWETSITNGIAASTTQTQAGGTALTVSFNIITAVANAGDAVTLPAPESGRDVYIINLGANSAKVFPSLGVDLGEGTNIEMNILANQMIRFKGTDASTWSRVVGAVADGTTMETTVAGVLQIKDNGVTLDKLAGGTANYIFATDSSGNPTLIDKNSVGGISELVESWPPSSPVVGKTYVLNGDGEERTYFDTATYSVRNSSGTSWVDGNPPTLLSATVASDGDSITLVFSEPVTVGADSWAGFNLDSEATTDNAMTYVSGDGTSTIVFSLASTVYSYESPDLDYTQAGDGVQDAAGNVLASIVSGAVVNGSTEFSYIVEETFNNGVGVAPIVNTWEQSELSDYEAGRLAVEYSDQYARVDFGSRDYVSIRAIIQFQNFDASARKIFRVLDPSKSIVDSASFGINDMDLYLGAGAYSSFEPLAFVSYYLWIDATRNGTTYVRMNATGIKPAIDDPDTTTRLVLSGATVDSAMNWLEIRGRAASRAIRVLDLWISGQEIGDI